MTLKALENLVQIKQLKKEPPDQKEIDGLLRSARRSLQDAGVEHLSMEGRFSCAYGAAHSAALAALRWHGYRSNNRYLVFQCLRHTLGLEPVKVRLLDHCHHQRNLAEYEGYLEFAPKLLQELADMANELITRVEKMGPLEPAE